jgi:hypothetical protein
MAMKTKMLAFVPESFMFVGANYDNEGKLGIVTFTDDCEMLKKARQLTDEALENDKGYLLLENISKQETYSIHCKPLKNQAHKAKTDIWSILFHNFLLAELRSNGWTILTCPRSDYADYDLTENHMEIG